MLRRKTCVTRKKRKYRDNCNNFERFFMGKFFGGIISKIIVAVFLCKVTDVLEIRA